MAETDEAAQNLAALILAGQAEIAERQMDHAEDLHKRVRAAAKVASKSSSSSDNQYNKNQSQYNKKQEGLLKSIVQNISLPLPGGARLFGLSSFMDKIGETTTQFQKGQESQDAYEDFKWRPPDARGQFAKQSEARNAASEKWRKMSDEEQEDSPNLNPENIEKRLKKESDDAMSSGTMKLKTLTAGFTAAATAVALITEGLRALGKSLGGVSEGQALSELAGAIGTSFTGLLEGRLRFPGRTLEMQGAAGQEFGQLISSTDAAIMSDVVTDFGLTTNQMAKLERTFQATAMGSREAMQSFAEVGIVGQVAATELAANAGAVARAGDNFNTFIRDGIKHAKQLGLEFSKMESTLTGFTMDFAGTISGFSELRAVIPGMATDFGQLMSTAMTGTTDEYIGQIKSSLLGAGIGSASDLNRQQAALLEKATGFSADQIDRILKGEDLNANIEQDLNEKRNLLLVAQMGIMGGILGATIASWNAIDSAIKVAAWGAAGTVATGIGAGIVAGGVLKNTALNDAYITKDGVTQRFSDDDNILLTKSGLGGGRASQLDRLETRKQTQAIERLTRVMSGPQEINLKNWRQAERSAMDASIRGA